MTAPETADDFADINRALAALKGEEEPEAITPDIITPSGLGPMGAAFYIQVAQAYTLRLDDFLVLEGLCRQLDLIEALRAEWENLGSPLMSTGVAGQLVTHPLIDAQDRALKTVMAAARQLRLPDLDTGISPFSHAGRGQAGGTQRAINAGETLSNGDKRTKHRGRRKPATGGN
ncbi:hypothetical protein [Nocardioides panzhihuensis]|uniref:P27 family phage terminase small subunit n=1 Tax=Nocardioides panzhihuensis TaxID=860243 RepID=A0A7Z0DJG3_9ACTN|nr:hypothetical protein [Nocardioides panzhihuensis]NYI76628.1 hypothetical protein [Nocardioides panzhihuensis]